MYFIYICIGYIFNYMIQCLYGIIIQIYDYWGKIGEMLTDIMSIVNDEHKHILWHIYDNYRVDMFKMALSVIRDYHFAEDVVQASFERIINKMHLVEKIPCNGLKSYAVLIVKNVAINMSIKEDRYKLEPDEEFEAMVGKDTKNIEDLVILNEQIGVIRKCLNEMDEKYTHPMIFRYYYGFSDSETAELLGINSASTVRSLCHRGKKMMIKAMQEAGDLHD